MLLAGNVLSEIGFRLSASGMLRKMIVLSISAAAAPLAQAQGEGEPSSRQLEEVVITGSRIVRSGYDTPTPLTVIGEEELQSSGTANLADFINQLPAFSGSVTPSTSNRALSSGAAGVNTLSLRGLGSSRTLVLLDGHRSVGSLSNGTVDINTIPQGLVKSVEVVTGGASATYGSDAVAGVVNFILDRDYTGFKADFEGGETTIGDDRSWSTTLTGGMPFADGRGHVLFNAKAIRRDGIYGAGRDWANNGMHMTQNPAYEPGNGLPQYLPTKRSGLNTLTGGGIITSGSQRGVYFGPGGVINNYNYGENYSTATSGAWTVGGDWQQSQHNELTSLQPEEQMDGIFGRLSFELNDAVELFAEASWNKSRAQQWGGQQTDKSNITIRADNAFLPGEIADALAANGETSFRMGSWNADIPTRFSDNERVVERYVVGADGQFSLFNQGWNWDTYYQYGVTNADEKVHAANRARLLLARDAVVDPASGEIVCRGVLNGNAAASGCVPFNSFGIGVNEPGVADYFMGFPFREQKFEQEVAALNFSTNITNPWTDAVGMAFGVEYRKESISGSVDDQFNTGWIVGNYLPTFGEYDVTEAYVETLVPLPLGLEFNGAARVTDYSESGTVTTWKLGLSWSPIDDLRLRATQSRDIRAPNLAELFQAGIRNTNSLSDRWNDDEPTRFTQNITGNLDLEPEEADTLGLGLIYRPSFLPGLGLSVDYYDIQLDGAIASLGVQDLVNRCFTGNEELCQRLTLLAGGRQLVYGRDWNFVDGPGGPVSEFLIENSPYNYVEQRARGVDIEVSYDFPLGRGDMTLRALATHALEMSENDGVSTPTDRVGQNTLTGPADWIYRLSATYNLDRLTAQVIGRGISDGVYDNTWIECQTGCPASTGDNRTITDNSLSGAFYVDTYFAYSLPLGNTTGQFFLKINNLFNEDPEPVGLGPGDSTNVEVGINRALYDYLGRSFRIGVRMEL